MITRRTFFMVSAVVATFALSASAFVGWTQHNPDRRMVKAHWEFNPTSLAQMAAHSDAIVVARAESSSAGRTACDDSGYDCLQFENVAFSTLRPLKGDVGGTFELERVAASSDEAIFFDGDGGEYEAGRTYLLFLDRGEPGNFILSSDQGRFDVTNGRLHAVAREGGAASVLHGRSLDGALRLFGR